MTFDAVDAAIGFTHCAKWCDDHRQATRFIVRRGTEINESGRKVSMRLDIEPELARRAAEYGLDDGTYRGIDHNITADLARYIHAVYGIDFNTRRSASDQKATGGAAA